MLVIYNWEALGSHLQSSTLNFLHANHLEWQQFIQHHHCIHHHLGEEFLLDSNQL